MEATCKLGEKGCWNDGKCRATSHCENKIVTNADRIRAMSDEELAKFIREPFCDKRTYDECKISYCGVCEVCVMDWLKQLAEEGQQ